MPKKQPSDIVTRSGVVLDDAAVDRIVAEVDSAVLAGRADFQFRGKGRPSLSGSAEPSPHVGFRVTPQLRRQAQELAQRQGVTVSELARQALEEYIAHAG